MEEPDLVETFRKQVGDQVFKIWPQKPLEPGEYAVVQYQMEKLDMQVWDFFIAPGSWRSNYFAARAALAPLVSRLPIRWVCLYFRARSSAVCPSFLFQRLALRARFQEADRSWTNLQNRWKRRKKAA